MNRRIVLTALFLLAVLIVEFAVFRHLNIKETVALISLEAEEEWAGVEKALQELPEEAPPPQSLRIPIFIYHHIRPYVIGESARQNQFDITPELFDQQLAYLENHGFTTITLDDLMRDVASGTTTPAHKPVILTFDDGWENQYEYAFPLLKKHHMIGTFYVYTNPIGTRVYFTWDQLREMDAAGMTIADHTLSHPYFKKISLDEVRREVVESKKILEEKLGKPVLHFASPYGYTDENIQKIVREAGYKTARTTYKGTYHAKDSLMKLRGILVNDSLNDFIRTAEEGRVTPPFR